jgi:hypothetical protein
MYSIVVHGMSIGNSLSRSVNNFSKEGWRYIYISCDVNFGKVWWQYMASDGNVKKILLKGFNPGSFILWRRTKKNFNII